MCRPGKAFNFLKEHGYNIMAVPREDVRLMQLFLLEKKKLYPLDSHLEGADLPQGETDKTVADFNGQAMTAVKAKLGLQVLDSYIGALGFDIKTAYERARKFVFSFEQVTRESVGIGDVEKAAEGVAFQSTGMRERAEAGRLFLVTSLLRSPMIHVRALDSHGTGIQVEIAGLGPVTPEMGVTFRGDRQDEVTYKRSKSLAFAVQTYQCVAAEGQFQRLKKGQDKFVAYDITSSQDPFPLESDGRLNLWGVADPLIAMESTTLTD